MKGMKSPQVRELLPRASEEAVHRDYFVAGLTPRRYPFRMAIETRTVAETCALAKEASRGWRRSIRGQGCRAAGDRP